MPTLLCEYTPDTCQIIALLAHVGIEKFPQKSSVLCFETYIEKIYKLINLLLVFVMRRKWYLLKTRLFIARNFYQNFFFLSTSWTHPLKFKTFLKLYHKMYLIIFISSFAYLPTNVSRWGSAEWEANNLLYVGIWSEYAASVASNCDITTYVFCLSHPSHRSEMVF